MKLLSLTRGKFAMVDDEDYQYLNQFNWSYNPRKRDKYEHTSGYAQRAVYINGKQSIMFLHREVMKCSIGDGKIIDIINDNGLDCQKKNLRFSNESGYKKSRRSSGTSKYLGVSIGRINKKKQIKWRADIKTGKGQVYLGSFESEIDAARAYNKAAITHHKEFAKLNEV